MNQQSDPENINNGPLSPEKPGRQLPAWRKALSYLLKYGVPLLITVLLCRLLFKDVNFDEMMSIISEQCDFRWILLAMVISIFSHIFRAMRWSLQLSAIGIKVPLFALILSIFGTYAVNLVLPRLGEIWRTTYISRRQKAPFASVFGSMVADRLADTVTVLLLTVVTFVLATAELSGYLSSNSESFKSVIGLLCSPWVWMVFIAGIAFIWWFLTRKTDNKFVNKAQGFIKGLWSGFAAVATMPGRGKWLLLTVCIWGCYFLQLYVAFFAFEFTAQIVGQWGTLAVLVTFVLSSISMGVPSNGGIGPWQWSVILALGIYGLGQAPATAFANLVMGSQTFMLILLGLFTFVCIALDKRRNSASDLS